MYLTLNELKKHLNIDSYFTDDDSYIASLGAAAEDTVSKYINRNLDDLLDENDNLPAGIKHAILLWVGSMYAVRESVSSSNLQKVPNSFELLCDLYRKYDENES